MRLARTKTWRIIVLGWLCGCAATTHGTSVPATANANANASAPAGASAALLPAKRESTLLLSIVGTNDVHGHLEQLPLLGGYLKNLRAARARDHGGVLLLDAGDIFQGTLESNLGEGVAMLHAYRALGVDAAALGNHELDFGPVGPHAVPLEPSDDPLGALTARVHEASFPFLCANLVREVDGRMAVPGVKASVQLMAAGIRVGVIGGLTRDALSLTHADNVHGLRVLPLAESVAEQAAALRAGGAQLVIAVVHAGGDCKDVTQPDRLDTCEEHAEVFELARALPAHALDLIIAGHTHAGVAQLVNGVPIIEAYSNGRAFGRVDLRVETGSGKVVETAVHPPQALCAEDLGTPACTRESYEGAVVLRDDAVLQAIAGDMALAKAERERPLGVTVTRPFERALKAESALGNLVADSMLHAFPNANVAINNAGGVRASLPAGPVDYGRVFEVFPFDNVLATLRLTVAQLAAILRANLSGEHGILAIAGLRARAECEGEQLRVTIQTPGGQKLAEDAKLTLVTSDYLASGGDGLFGSSSVRPGALTVYRNRSMRDALISYLQKKPRATLDGQAKSLFDPAAPRIRYPGQRPVHCGNEHHDETQHE